MAPQNNSDAFAPAAQATVRNFGNWGVYAAAAGATLAMASNADAGVIYRTVNKTVSVATTGTNSSAKSIRSSITASLRIHRNTLGTGSGTARLNIASFHLLRKGTATGGGNTYARKFAVNSLIGPSANDHGHGGTVLFKHTALGSLRGDFGGTQPSAFAGFKTSGGDYGWIRISTSAAGSPGFVNEFTVIDYARNKVPGTPIHAGEGLPTGAPEPSSAALGLLAAGAAGLAAWRRRRNEVAAK